MGNTLAVIGYVRSSAVVMWIRCLLLVSTGIPAAIVAGANGMAAAFLISEALTTFATLYFYRTHLPQFSMAGLGRALVRPALSTLFMLVVVMAADLVTAAPLPLLLGKAAIGALSYGGALYVLWHLSGYPEGLERLVVERIRLMRKFA
jgi:hypothetical protein